MLIFSLKLKNPRSWQLSLENTIQWSSFQGGTVRTWHSDYVLWWCWCKIYFDNSKFAWSDHHKRTVSKVIRDEKRLFLYSRYGPSVKTYIFFAYNPTLLPFHHLLLMRTEEVEDESLLLGLDHRVPAYSDDYLEFSHTNSHVEVPDLYFSWVKWGDDPWLGGMEGYAFNTWALYLIF